MKLRIIDVEGEAQDLLPLVTLLLESGGIDQLAAPAVVPSLSAAAPAEELVVEGSAGLPSSKTCRRCHHPYRSWEHRQAHAGPGVVIPKPRPGVCRKCGHGVRSLAHREQCRGELVASPGVGNGDREIAELRQPTGTRCAHCSGAMYVDDGERKCLNCGRPARPLESYTPPALGPEKQRRRGPTVQGVKV